MKTNRPLAAVSLVGRNAVVIGGVFWRGWSASAALILYFCEAVFIAILAALLVRMKAPASPANPEEESRSEMLRRFLLTAGGFAIVVGFVGYNLGDLASTMRADFGPTLREVSGGIAAVFFFDLLDFAFAGTRAAR